MEDQDEREAFVYDVCEILRVPVGQLVSPNCNCAKMKCLQRGEHVLDGRTNGVAELLGRALCGFILVKCGYSGVTKDIAS